MSHDPQSHDDHPHGGGLSALTLGGIGLAVVALYALVLAGGGHGFWRSFLTGGPVGLEAVLADDDTASASRLDEAFARMGYRLEAVAKGQAVPPVFLTGLPGDLDSVEAPDDKKRLFFRVMLPLVLVVNEEIAEDRRRLAEMAQGRDLDEGWLAEVAQRYGVEGGSIAQLLRRVDAVPPSLALAQAAEESGWGTSRFVREGNNLFGHIAPGDDGIQPQGDSAGPRMAAFATLHEAVRAYMHNLNTHPAYEPLRRSRAAARARGAFPDGHTLAGALSSYSERGTAYVDTIRAIIRKNGLARFDRAKLDRGGPGSQV